MSTENKNEDIFMERIVNRNKELFNEAVEKHDIEGVKSLENLGFKLNKELLDKFTTMGDFETVEWMKKNGCNFEKK